MARAYLQPVGNSGVSAELTFFESVDGGTLIVQGAASGMRMFGRYVSLVTDLESNPDAILPGPDISSGWIPERPIPSARDPTFLGAWHGLLGAAIGTMRVLQIEKATAAADGFHIYEISTVSIHRPLAGSMPGRLRRNGPQCRSLQACGELVRVP